MLTRAARRRWWALVVFTGVLLGFVALSAAGPDSASGGVLGDIKDGIGGLIGGGAKKVAGAVGGGVMKEVLEFLLGGLEATINLEVIKWVTHIDLSIGPSLSKLGGPMVVIGGFFLIVGLITSVGDSYREVVAGTDTAARAIGQAIFRVIGLALLMGAWSWLVPLAVEVANGMSAFVLDDGATKAALDKSLRAQMIMSLNPLFALITGLLLVCTALALVVMKFVIVIMFAALYLGGPVLIGFSALPRVGNAPLSMALRGTLTLMVIPLAWAVVFAAWAGVSAGITENVDKAGDVVRVLTGPALFLAGMAVLFGITKKLLSMATFGAQLSMPGGRMLRTVATMAAVRGIGSAAGATAAGGAKGGGGANPALEPTMGAAAGSAGRSPGGNSAAAQQDGAGQGQGPRSEWQPPPPSGNPQQEMRRRRAETENLRTQQREVENNSPLDIRGGAFGSYEARRETVKARGAQVQELRKQWGGPPPDEKVAQALSDVGPGASAAAGAARTQLRTHPGDRLVQQDAYSLNIDRKTAGVEFSREPELQARHEANWATISAATPEQVERLAGHERDQHDWHIPNPAAPEGRSDYVDDGLGGDPFAHGRAQRWPRV